MSKILSIITTIYNGEKYINRYINYFQTGEFDCKKYEWIFYNDGSTDDTELTYSQLTKYQGVTFISNPKNLGRSSALNAAIRSASTPLLAIHDVDDFFHKERFDKQVEYLLNNQDVHILGTDAYYKNENGSSYKKIFPRSNYDIRKIFSRGVPLCNTTVCYRRIVFDALGGYPNRTDGKEDYEFWICAMEYGFKFSVLHEALAIHVLHRSSFWSKYSSRRSNQFKLLKLQFNAIKRLSLPYYHFIFPLSRLFLLLFPSSILSHLKSRFYITKNIEIDLDLNNARFN
jgi:glycosyltransferase involved in cell wall biosynthesis